MPSSQNSNAPKKDFYLPVEEMYENVGAEITLSEAIRNYRASIITAIVVLLAVMGSDIHAMTEDIWANADVSLTMGIMIGAPASCIRLLLYKIQSGNAHFAKRYGHWFETVLKNSDREDMTQTEKDVLQSMRAKYIPLPQTGKPDQSREGK